MTSIVVVRRSTSGRQDKRVHVSPGGVSCNTPISASLCRWTCKYHTSNDVFSRCKSVHKMATGKIDDELIQSDNKMRIGTRSGKFIIVD